MLKTVFLLWLAAVNLALFALMGLDKSAAQGGLRRIPETTLLCLAVLGGSVGGLLAMPIFRHKTQKPAFSVGIPAILLVQAAVAYLCFR